MVGKLITLPLRVPLRSAQLLTRAAVELAGRAVSITGQAIEVVMPRRPEHGQAAQAAPPASPNPQRERRDEPAEKAVSPAGVEHPPAPSATVVEDPGATVAEPPGATVAEAPAEWTEEPPAPLVQEPAHVSEEPELVEESAEPGAEEGAGADVSVVEPWDGYGRMSAKDVIDRAGTASAAELAAIRLYEAQNRARQTVLAEVDRQLRLANGGRIA